MTYTLDLTQEIKDFDGGDIFESKDVRLTLKNALLNYFRNMNMLGGFTNDDLARGYGIGMKIGVADKEVVFTKEEYKTLLAVCEKHGKLLVQGQSISLYLAVVTSQILIMVENMKKSEEE